MTDAPPPTCPNCEAPLADPRPRFCPDCGQETNVRPPRLGEFVQQFGGAYLSTEGALWRTLRLLLTRPGELTAQYLRGRRKHYVLPLRLYLTVSVIVLIAMRVMTGIALDNARPEDVVRHDGPKPTTMVLDLGGGRAGVRDGVFFCEELPQWVCRRLQSRLDLDPKAMQRQVRELGVRFVGNLGAAMFVLLPVFAAALAVAYRSRRLRYTEHLVFALHVHAFWFGMVGLSMIELPGADAIAFTAIPVYTLMAMRRVYGGRWGPRLLRAAFVGTVYLVAMGIALSGVALWAVLA